MGKAICSKVRLQIDPGAVTGGDDRGGERSGCVVVKFLDNSAPSVMCLKLNFLRIGIACENMTISANRDPACTGALAVSLINVRQVEAEIQPSCDSH
jgi:hypothetical protein